MFCKSIKVYVFLGGFCDCHSYLSCFTWDEITMHNFTFTQTYIYNYTYLTCITKTIHGVETNLESRPIVMKV